MDDDESSIPSKPKNTKNMEAGCNILLYRDFIISKPASTHNENLNKLTKLLLVKVDVGIISRSSFIWSSMVAAPDPNDSV